MAKEVKVNLDLLDNAKKVYDESIETLESTVKTLSKAIDELRTKAWKTNGADAFFENYDDSWKKDLDKHISYLKHLRDCLATAKTAFHERYDSKM